MAVPALFAAAWAVLVFGGAIENLQHGERAAARRVLDRYATALEREIDRLADERRVIDLGEDGRPVGPFATAGDAPALAAELPVELDIALELESRGQHAEALRFFEHARARKSWPGAAILAYARSLAATGSGQQARKLLAEASASDTGVLSFELLRALLDARIAAATGDLVPLRQVAARLVSFELSVPAAAAPALIQLLDSLGDHGVDPSDYLAVAAVQAALAAGDLSPPSSPVRGPLGSWLVPRGERRVLVVSKPALERLAKLAQEEIDDSAYALASAPGAAEPLARRAIAPLGREMLAIPRETAASKRLAQLARVLAGLTLVAFFLANLFAVRTLRRELVISRMKSEFIDLVSHELRTPLTALSLKAEMLARGDVPGDRQDEYARALFGEVQRLNALVHRVLDFARLEKGRTPIEPRVVAARSLLESIVTDSRDAVRAAGKELVLEAPADLPTVEVDPDVLGRAFRNLFENAAKYAPDGTTITVLAETDDSHLRIRVADEGPGIPPGERSLVFEPFRRGHAAGSTSGSGLGLAIARQAVAAHSGSLDIEDGRGNVFVLTIPTSGGAA